MRKSSISRKRHEFRGKANVVFDSVVKATKEKASILRFPRKLPYRPVNLPLK